MIEWPRLAYHLPGLPASGLLSRSHPLWRLSKASRSQSSHILRAPVAVCLYEAAKATLVGSACRSAIKTRKRVGSSLFLMAGLLGLPEGTRATRCPGSGPLPVSRTSATHPNPAWRPKPPSLWPQFLQPCTRPSRGPPRSLTVVPLIADKRYYGEAPMGLRGYERAVEDAVPPPFHRIILVPWTIPEDENHVSLS